MKAIFVFSSRLKWEYFKIMEVQEVTMEVQEESLQYRKRSPIALLKLEDENPKLRNNEIKRSLIRDFGKNIC